MLARYTQANKPTCSQSTAHLTVERLPSQFLLEFRQEKVQVPMSVRVPTPVALRQGMRVAERYSGCGRAYAFVWGRLLLLPFLTASSLLSEEDTAALNGALGRASGRAKAALANLEARFRARLRTRAWSPRLTR